MIINIKQKNRFEEISFSDIMVNSFNKEALEYIKNYSKNIESKINDCENLILCGNVGTGKTMLVNAFKNSLKDLKVGFETLTGNFVGNEWEKVIKERDFLIHYTTCKKIIENIRDEKFNKDNLIENEIYYKNQDILIIDEVGIQFKTDGERTTLFDLFNYRWENYKPTWIISNHELKQEKTKFQDLYSILGSRICDRLMSNSSKYFYLEGKSMR